jgi:uncharacterized protein (TIGR01777 family)
MRIIVTGASGLIGSALTAALKTTGDNVIRVVRSEQHRQADAVRWDPESGAVDRAAFENADAVVHLAGENIAQGRWTPAKKARIRDSRVNATAKLCQTIATLDRPPKTLLCASAVGYYGDRGNETLTEASLPGTGFLANVCREWEAATVNAARKGIRIANLRFGVVLSATGGALAKLLPSFRLGLGGIIGRGAQYMSWISLDDAVGAIRHVLPNETLNGPINMVAPNAVTNREFTKALGSVLFRPTILPLPALVIRLLFGEMADALLLSSQRVKPTKLVESGYIFQQPNIEIVLRQLLRRL